MRPVVSSQGWLVDLSLRSPRQRWWRKSQTTRDKTQPCLRGKSETDCWQRASATTTPFPASHPLTGRKQQPNTTQSTYLGCCDASSILIVFGERTGCRIFREDELKVRTIHPTCVWARRPQAEYCLTQVCVEARLAISEVQFNLSDPTPSTISSTSRTEWMCRDENRSIFGDQIPWRYKEGQFSWAHLMCCSGCCCWTQTQTATLTLSFFIYIYIYI